LNRQQQGGQRSQTRQENNQREQENNSQFDYLEDSSDNGGQVGQRGQFIQQGHKNQNHHAGRQRNQQQGQGISLQRENIQFLQGQAKALVDSYGGQGQ
jgi:hypothetical protein